MMPRWSQVARLGEKVHKGAPMLRSETLEELYEYMLTQWHDPAAVVVGFVPESAPAMRDTPELAGLSGVERMMAQDMLGYLTDDILVKVDRAAMAVSLETRVPLLDPEVVEFAWRLPLDLKIRGNTTKWILRQVLYRHVPPVLIERPKMGFGIPVGDWLRGPLRDWAEALIDERRLREEGFFHAEAVRESWNALLRGNPREQLKLWTILMFQSWHEAQDFGRDAGEERVATALAS
jgi:asparagine synthase (glutamine-hydrolysing)